MRKLLVVLILSACAPQRQPVPVPAFEPIIYVVYDCGDPLHDHERPEDATLDPDWPSVICIGGCR